MDDIIKRLEAAAEKLDPMSVSSRVGPWHAEAVVIEDAIEEIRALRAQGASGVSVTLSQPLNPS